MSEIKNAVWAHCPYCPEYAHTAVFPVQVSITVNIDWETGEANSIFSADTQPLKHHLRTLHPDKVLTEAKKSGEEQCPDGSGPRSVSLSSSSS